MPLAPEILKLAADAGHREAQYNLSLMYAKGEGVAKDDSEAVRHLRLAAEQGLPQAQHSLGLRYSDGRGVEQSDDEAVMWVLKAAEQGYRPSIEALKKAELR